MDSSSQPKSSSNSTGVSCIIPVYNEEQTIEAVIAIAKQHPLIAEVIVVDDGSSDRSAEIAKERGANVIRHSKNMGKAESMDSGVASCRGDMILFLDADLLRLTADHLTALIEPVAKGRADMTVAIRDRGKVLSWMNAKFGAWIAGERCLNRSMWNSVPVQYKRGFMIELALNATARHLGLRILPVLLPGLSIRRKEQKIGLVKGTKARLVMTWQLMITWIKLYLSSSSV